MAIIRVEVYRQAQEAEVAKAQLELKHFEVTEPKLYSDAICDTRDVGGQEQGLPESIGPVWVIVATKS